MKDYEKAGMFSYLVSILGLGILLGLALMAYIQIEPSSAPDVTEDINTYIIDVTPSRYKLIKELEAFGFNCSSRVRCIGKNNMVENYMDFVITRHYEAREKILTEYNFSEVTWVNDSRGCCYPIECEESMNNPKDCTCVYTVKCGEN